ncbi:MAG TPA: UvrD-helicase domain-containing protein [Candidatus Acidoferrales bacterium]|jgi:superfamily I DNA/RNA helicase|nr:UvrD-helicase domain-containing protein [Candidatus Acidoferrales bacterium]
MVNLNTLNPQQREAAATIKGPVLILAGAGTGKTRVITYRIAHMVDKGIKPGNILGVTFTNKAAREMQERVTKLLPKRPRAKSNEDKTAEKANRPTICTFHSLCVRILRQHIEKLGYKKSFVIYDESEQLAAVKKILSAISAKGEKTDPGAVLGMLSKFKNGGENSATFGDPSVRALAQHIAKRYESALHACNAVDFDDLILLTLRLFCEHPDALEACRVKYQYVMVDEYQDTNAAQFELVHSLTKEHRNFCVVGDDDQSIYGWRGAEVANLLNLEKHFPEVKIVKLEQNYRSTTTILHAANAIIKNNVQRRGKSLWSDKGPGSKIQLNTYNHDEDEAREVVSQIEFKRIAHRVPWQDCAILFRTNQQSRPVETELRKAGVRYHLIGGQSFFDRREIKDFIAYVKMFLNPNDDISLLRIANVPARGLSDVTMERLLGASHDRKCSVFAAMKNPMITTTFQTPTRKSIEAFVEFVERVHGELLAPASGLMLAAWADNFLNETGYLAELKRLDKDEEVAEGRIRNIREMLPTMDGVGNAPMERLENFLENITLDSDREEDKENTSDAVTLITMHSCKGLEFPHVFIVGLEDGLLPHSRSKVEGTMDEERRLFYVAVTRAMQTLSISHCGGRKKYGQLLPCQPSPFLKELPPELVEHSDPKSRTPIAAESGKNLFAAIRESIS